ncbi:MAG: IS5 family transposase [Myxococcales bacterium]|nr:IS5 family transposase [Myxococcales bacterium]
MQRHELSEEEWTVIKPLLVLPPGRPPLISHRKFLNAVLWKIRTGVPWRDLPEQYGSWKTIYSRFRRWAIAGYFQAIFEALHIEVDDEWNAIDGTYIRAHQHSAGGHGGAKKMALVYLVEVVQPRSMLE